MPAVAAAEVATTELQQSIFNLTASSTAVTPATAATAATAVTAAGVVKPSDAATTEDVDADGPHGTKRRREDESDDEDAPMEEGDSDAPMDASSDDDSS